MYSLANRSPWSISCATRNHSLRYAALRRRRQVTTRIQTSNIWSDARSNADNTTIKDSNDASLDGKLEEARNEQKENWSLNEEHPRSEDSEVTEANDAQFTSDMSIRDLEKIQQQIEIKRKASEEINRIQAEMHNVSADRQKTLRDGIQDSMRGAGFDPERMAFVRRYMDRGRNKALTPHNNAPEAASDAEARMFGLNDGSTGNLEQSAEISELKALSDKLQDYNLRSTIGLDGRKRPNVIFMPKDIPSKTTTSGGDSDEYPQWFLDNNVILSEEAAAHLPAGDIKLTKGTGEEVEVSEGYEGLRSLLEQYQVLYEEEEMTDDSLDDKVGPFATVPSIRKLKEKETQIPRSYLSLPHYLEVALSIATGLSPHPADQPWTWATYRTFLALYAPLDGSTDFLNQVVQSIAKSQGADVIHLSALDLADLSTSMPSWDGAPFLSSLSSISYSTHKAFAENQREEKEKDDEAEEDNDGQVQFIQVRGQPMGFRIDGNRGSRGGGYFMPHDRDVLMGQSIKELGRLLDAAQAKRSAQTGGRTGSVTDIEPRKLIICVSDFAELSYNEMGQAVLKALEDLVQGRRKKQGEEIMIIGTSSSSDTTTKGIANVQEQLDAGSESTYYRALIVPPFQEGRMIDAQVPMSEVAEVIEEEQGTEQDQSLSEMQEINEMKETARDENDLREEEDPGAVWEKADAHRIFNINSRHLKTMISQFCEARDSSALSIPLDLEQNIIDEYEIDTQILSLTDIHRIAVLTAGIQQIKDSDAAISMNDIKLAMSMIDANYTETMTPDFEYAEEDLESLALNPPRIIHDLDSIKAKCSKWEKRLFHCIISPQQLSTTFSKVHTKPETIDALRTLTSMSLLRPDSFSYGVLQSESIPGVLLYGPPGTGKTLLAKAVAKESGATMLAITSSEINHKYVGESEKTVRAIFSLARKLSPCVVFIDEADSLFQSRDAYHSRAGSHETMNQFLSEIEHFGGSTASDGSDNVFLMIATNRPFDLDDAILRRVPRRLLIDLPTEKDREEILKIHLRGEDVVEDVSISALAQRTPFYSGSDLKNLCVAAALACVRDENAAAKVAREASDKTFKYPAKRTLMQEHFEIAIGEISASISEDMSTLTQIRKFDEKYGDRKGRREKTVLGFGQRKITDDMLRVRV
jgi:SpoVK/Ycf46/Vps4 family AAA+-type ATPase